MKPRDVVGPDVDLIEKTRGFVGPDVGWSVKTRGFVDPSVRGVLSPESR